MDKILFVCTGNTCRSPMAEVLWNKRASDRGLDIKAESCGLCTISGLPASENSIVAAGESGAELSDFRSTSIADIRPDDYMLIAVMTESHARALREFGISEDKIYILNREGGGISDPYGYSIERYRACRDEIDAALGVLMDELV